MNARTRTEYISLASWSATTVSFAILFATQHPAFVFLTLVSGLIAVVATLAAYFCPSLWSE